LKIPAVSGLWDSVSSAECNQQAPAPRQWCHSRGAEAGCAAGSKTLSRPSPTASRQQTLISVFVCSCEVAEIVQRGLAGRNVLKRNYLLRHTSTSRRKLLILLVLWVWLAALDDFRNWLIREAAQLCA
jgi:hypothetical protein